MNVRKVFVITGGARGIGRGLVDRFLKADCCVSTCDVVPFEQLQDADATTAATEAAKPSPLSSSLYQKVCDVSMEYQVKEFIQETVERFGQIDCVINNAAVASPYLNYERFEEIDIDEYLRFLKVNLVGPTILMKYCVPLLRKRASTNNDDDGGEGSGGGGSIINISSTRAKMSEPKCEGYAASKGGIESLTHAAAISLQNDGIRVNGVAPGWIHTPNPDYEPTAEDHAFHPAQRVGMVDDIYHMCDFLSDSKKSGFITGQTFTVDGGVTRKMIYPDEE